MGRLNKLSPMFRSGIIFIFALMLAHRAGGAPRSNTPDMTYVDNGVVRLGVDLNLGGAITWLSKSKSDLNLINSWDWGRQVQM